MKSRFAAIALVLSVACESPRPREPGLPQSRDASAADGELNADAADAAEPGDAQSEADATARDAGDSGVVLDREGELRALFGLNAGSCYRFETSIGAQAQIAAENNKWIYIRGLTEGDEQFTLEGDTISYLSSIRLAPNGANREGEELVFDTPGPWLMTLNRAPLEIPPNTDFNSSSGGSENNVTILPGNVRMVDGVIFPNRLYTSLVNVISVQLPSGATPGLRIELSDETGDVWSGEFVPNYGPAKFVDVEGVVHTLCNARVCDAAGNCDGPDCATLVCR